MRKLYCFILIAIFYTAGCSRGADDLGELSPKGIVSTRALQEQLRDPIRESIARSFEMGQLSYNVSENDARVLLDALADESEPYELDYVINETETMLYVVNYTGANGWKLLSTDKRTQPVLAYGQSGRFVLDSLNPGEAIWLEEVYDLLGELQGGGAAPGTEDEFIDEADPSWVDLAPATRSYNWQDDGEWVKDGQQTIYRERVVGPLTKTLWDQDPPWNDKVTNVFSTSTEKCPAGCVAIAAAQMLYYLHYHWGVPVAMYEEGGLTGVTNTYAHSFSNFTTGVWDKMPTYNIKNAILDPKYAATLIAYVGMKVDMNYGPGGSGATTEKLKDLFDELGVKSEYSDFKTRYVLPNLDKGIPTLVRAKSSTGTKKGHAWVLDGYKQDYRQIVTLYRWYTYYTTDIGAGEGEPITLPDPDRPVLDSDKEVSIVDDVLESVDSLNNWPPILPRIRRPMYASDRTYTSTSTIWDGYYWHMNWGWGEGWNNWYATLEKWEVGGYTYNKSRQMLLITGYR